MSQNPTRPPKERVNIVYRAGTDGATQEQELPLKLLVMGDYTQQLDTTPVGERHPVRIDKDNFDAVMAERRLSLDINVPKTDSPQDAHGEHSESLNVHLEVRGLKDLTPEGICAQVEPLQKLLQLRQALVALKGPLGNVPAFRKGLQALLRDAQARRQLAQEIGIDAAGAAPKILGDGSTP